MYHHYYIDQDSASQEPIGRQQGGKTNIISGKRTSCINIKKNFIFFNIRV